MRFRLLAPNGRPIVGTLEEVRGLAEADEFTVNENGELEPAYTGSTKYYYDEQRAVMQGSQNVMIDDGGNEHLLDQCARIPVEP